MKVRYTLPISGTMRKEQPGPLVLDSYSFEFTADEETGFVNKLTVEIKNIPRERWPTLINVEQDSRSEIPRFPFEVNKDALKFAEIAAHLRNLESYLSVFGVNSIEFSLLRQEWLFDEEDEIVSIWQSSGPPKAEVAPIALPLTDDIIARCIAASSAEDNIETLFLSYFRVAQGHFSNDLFIETIKFSYLCLETLFGKGQTKNSKVSSAFAQSRELTRAIRELLFDQRLGSFDALCRKHTGLSAPEDVLNFFVKLRGRLQHANLHPNFLWHPSLQSEFREEAHCIFTLTEEVSLTRTLAKLRSVPINTLFARK